MDREGISDVQVLVALYNASRPLGMGFLQVTSGDMSVEEAETIYKAMPERMGRHYFDYLRGRVMKVDVSDHPLDLRLYDRDNGSGSGERAILEYVTSTTK